MQLNWPMSLNCLEYVTSKLFLLPRAAHILDTPAIHWPPLCSSFRKAHVSSLLTGAVVCAFDRKTLFKFWFLSPKEFFFFSLCKSKSKSRNGNKRHGFRICLRDAHYLHSSKFSVWELNTRSLCYTVLPRLSVFSYIALKSPSQRPIKQYFPPCNGFLRVELPSRKTL